jgi:phospholipid transport system substrate-binding protein
MAMMQLIHSSRRAAASRDHAGHARNLTAAVAVVAGLSWAPLSAMADDAPSVFINSLGQQAMTVIRRPDMPIETKTGYFRQLLRQDFDLNGISRFVLGPYWRVASPGERQQFSDLLTQRLIDVYGRRLAQASDGQFVVSGSRTGPDGVVVTSQIIRGQGAPIVVDWRLGVSDGHYAIEDVAIDGVSMAMAERSEIGDQISRDGGQIEPLLAGMREQD